ncbi:MAG: YcjF family protein [Prochlorococcus sp.]|nr:YcjF family protein [Prochlorococcaceae cyanobacterium Fu_MAG_50]
MAIAGGSLLIGQWVLSDLFHVPGGGLTLLVGGAGIWWLCKPAAPAVFSTPSSLQGWIKRCNEVIEQFSALEDESELEISASARHQLLDAVVDRSGPQSLAVVTSGSGSFDDQDLLQTSLACRTPVTLCWAKPLSQSDGTWQWPAELEEQDLLLYVLSLPLMAADLLWLKQVPAEQPAWLMVVDAGVSIEADHAEALDAQLPQRWSGRLLCWSGEAPALRAVLQPLRAELLQAQGNLDRTRMRLLGNLHRSWQLELEQLRRQRFQNLQQRTQWIVAGAVFASPVASADLLAVVVANGLLIREMAKLWGCNWTPDVLQVVARQLAAAALAQGVVEWSGQALLGVAKVDAGGWLAAGVMQALSAAYMTRVVGRSMADWLALNAGVAEPDLEALKRQAPVIVARAAEQERLDWAGFLQQASRWVLETRDSTTNEQLAEPS